jgi:MEDS: MEthanogen/methylotroph, DcmR Sensory domain
VREPDEHVPAPDSTGDTAAPRHFAQLFDDAETRADAVAAFILEGEARDEHVLIAVTAPHWQLVTERLTRVGYPLAARLADGRLRMLDAAATLDRVMRCARPDPARFDETIGAPIRQLCDGGARLRACGELVDLLAAQGEFRAVVALEQLWNGLVRLRPFTLFCLYSSVHFGHPRSQDALRQICRAHTGVCSNPADELGEWLLREQVRAFGPM